MQLHLEVTEQEGYAVVAVHGELDISNASDLRDRLIELSELGRRYIVVDLERTAFLDSTGLGVLIGALKRLRSQKGDLSLVCHQPRILKVFKITGLVNVFNFFPSVAAAVATRAD